MEKISTQSKLVPATAYVEAVTPETAGTVSVDVKLNSEFNGVFWTPGQFNMVHVFGNNEVPISVSRIHQSSQMLTHTIRGAGAASRGFLNLRKGDQIGLRGPFGNSWPLAKTKGKDVVIVAGGLGLAPLRPVIDALLTEPDLKRQVFLAYGTRTPETILFADELAEWFSEPSLQISYTVDQAPAGWGGPVGVVTDLVARMEFRPEETIAFVCGPEIMMRASVNTLLDMGISEQRIYLSLERNMKCATGFCGHCQFGPFFLCKDGPIFSYPQVKTLLEQREM